MDLRDHAPALTDHPVDVGQRSEAAVLSELVRRGYHVLVPFGFNRRYDLVIDLDGRFLRAQCKTGRLRQGSIEFRTCSIRSNTQRTVMRGYAGEADLFLVYCPETGGTYAVPVDEASRSHMYLRVDPAMNCQDRRVHWAKDYELPA
jgi:hypothetical protein